MANQSNKITPAPNSKPGAAGGKVSGPSSASPSPAAGAASANPFKPSAASVKDESKAVEQKGLDANVPAKYRKFQKQ